MTPTDDGHEVRGILPSYAQCSPARPGSILRSAETERRREAEDGFYKKKKNQEPGRRRRRERERAGKPSRAEPSRAEPKDKKLLGLERRFPQVMRVHRKKEQGGEGGGQLELVLALPVSTEAATDQGSCVINGL
ncbi:unnamed protein product [Pleuronectes platessa]|uniref:Uncharacterized protein n=1 Tax=Pleuronectes platessa TaxID=8262 RepID=A0A9N7YQV5_PLEPL|nr:unnamed protein product [Pleuronectes platessa]